MVLDVSPNRIVPEVSGSDEQPACPQNLFRWQWHRIKDGEHEWIDYTDADNKEIEAAFQSGATHTRVNTGKASSKKGNLKELFFGDMVQYNPVSGAVKTIRRVGPDSMSRKILRYILGYLHTLESGVAKHKSFLKYKQKLTSQSMQIKEVKPVYSERCQKIVNGGVFQLLQMVAIVLNTLLIGFDVEFNGEDASSETRAIFKTMDHAFCIFFTAEIMLRIGAMKKRPTWGKTITKAFKDRWFVFDFLLVLFMVVETWALPIFLAMQQQEHRSSGLDQLATFRLLRLVRLSRLGRIARLMKFFPETMTMVKSIIAATRAVLCTLGLLATLLYVFAIIFKARCEQTAIQHMFPSLLGSMWQLLLNGAFMDNLGETVDAIYQEDAMLAGLFMLFVFLSNLTVLNMLIGVICEVANNVSVKEKEMLSAKLLKIDLMEFLDCFDMDDDGSISMDEFDLLMKNPDVKAMLTRHDVDWGNVVSLKESLFIDKEASIAAEFEAWNMAEATGDDPNLSKLSVAPVTRNLSYDELVSVILRFRGGGGIQATMLDIVNLDKSMTNQMRQIERTATKGNSRRSRSNTTRTSKSVAAAGAAAVEAQPNMGSPTCSSSKDHARELQGDPQPELEPVVNGIPMSDECNVSQKQIEVTPIEVEEDPWHILKDELARQHSTFSAEIHEQIKFLILGQRELGKLMRDNLTSCARKDEPEAGIHKKPEAKVSQAPAQELDAMASAPAASKKPLGGADTEIAASDEWGSTRMHTGAFVKPTAAARSVPELS
eukprot:gnl/MRDRNA2_/MRDRNA2_100992_c0_seq1.p1 gnl/MRDRNA2_/MRDRNA2_100992_c0~~gnl/MRDRNA2_/MRDRNA2_100992_c0_seq1.p1  ORF type:complete len:771 (-),score=141.75 gnl/MRDRNA2_/MRDRNA2_100992_c0_seq1:300-2612(-)